MKHDHFNQFAFQVFLSAVIIHLDPHVQEELQDLSNNAPYINIS